MIIDQLSVFCENKAGMLAEIAENLADAGIDIEALTIADTTDFGVLRFIVDSPKKALSILKMNGFAAQVTPVIALRMKNEPGSLARIVRALADEGISIEYLYACVAGDSDSAFVILRVEDMENAKTALTEKGYEAYRNTSGV